MYIFHLKHEFFSGPLHRFPDPKTENLESIQKFSEWKAVLDGPTQERGDKYIYNHIRLCNKHFLESYQLPSRRLTKNAVPTLNLNKVVRVTEQLSPSAIGTLDTDEYSTMESAVPSEPSTSATPVQPIDIDMNQTTQSAVTSGPSTSVTPVQPSRKRKHSYTNNRNSKLIEKLKLRLEKLAKKYKDQRKKIQAAKNLSMNGAFLRAIDKLPEEIQIFTKLQLKSAMKPRGRRFSNQEKIMALTILKQSPKAYRLLQKMFVLPSIRCLQNLLSTFNVQPGINENLLNDLKNIARNLPKEKKLVNILFDEVSLAPGIIYNESSDQIIGFEDFGHHRKRILADHALVFMIKGIKSKCKQPICFTFCKASTKSCELKKLLTEVIKQVNGTGLRVVATICDQAATNVRVVRELLKETKAKYLRMGMEYSSNAFEVESYKIFPLFDTPHLLKGVRNNLLKKNAKYVQNGETKWAKWEHLKMLLDVDTGDDEIRLVNKLTEKHVIINKIPKMKVKYAAQVFSQRVSSALRFLSKHNILPEECKGTADFLLLFDKLFDSFNGHSYEGSSKVYKQCLKNNSSHFQLWYDLLPILDSIKFESVVSKNDSVKYESIPSVTNWIHNIKTFNEIWQYLNVNYGVKNLLTRNFNQDPLENFFSGIRSNGVRNINPNCNQFISAYKTLLINNFNSVHSVRANCENDCNKSFQSMVNLLGNKSNDSENNDFACDIDALLTTMNNYKNNDSLIYNESKKYVTGYVIKKMKSKIFKNCDNCARDLCRPEADLQSFNYEVDYTKKSLFHPSENFNNLMNEIYHIIITCLRDFPEAILLNKKIKYLLNCACDYDIITCIEHKEELIECINNLSIKLIIHSWCTGVNRILSGKMTKFDKNDHIKWQASEYCKKNKNKSN
ncbi:hypothetical protein PYW08_003507 [Mythimna loreyi]|uniref:Uncharacterized protein n=1 Tax=Mythimna loreyi TaxID=667449 RepID=A0ACC2QTD7_9NEOP|nr:hypothetical protein PYW08_003507 [Mythimna loreyi]